MNQNPLRRAALKSLRVEKL